jgi:hypothetical protein
LAVSARRLGERFGGDKLLVAIADAVEAAG